MQYDFDRVIDRRTIDSAKWTAYPKDVLPLWVADSDFQCPQPVIDAVMKIAETGVYGYPNGHAGIVEKATVSPAITALRFFRARFSIAPPCASALQ